ncbi:glycosyltransferase family 8 protein [Piedraia hortae CBS 480.64]|uniref:Glycosyltransferase family 8 protein n=1 Tax=Piedraia hortae CBS 480.64 TaxID=1314780 RepID=A0A6A7C5B0_9PEZI|nr:glycosyltransferase family 8 protein [Piedraia hortae CBS 480.64]
MRRILLTQSQATILLSSAVIFVFTLVLFLSGYVIQQRTLSGLQAAIKPWVPPAPPRPGQSLPAALASSRHFSGIDKQQLLSLTKDVDWTRLAHVQIARTHHDVCSAIMVLAELRKSKSPARRMLMFPLDWAMTKNTRGDYSDPELSSSRRLMKLAARRYGVELRPIHPVSSVYTIASAFALKEVDRVLALQAPGLVLDAMALDALLAFYEETAPLAVLDGESEDATDLMLLQPDQDAHGSLIKQIHVNYNDSLLPTLLEPARLSFALQTLAPLHSLMPDDYFDGEGFLKNASYLRFRDPKLPGPEYDIPYSERVAARPKNKDADWTWTKLYGRFAQKRMEICGLELETWRP